MASKISVIATIFNEEKTIERLLNALAKQILLPDEVVLTDGGSSDRTLYLIKAWQRTHKKIKIKVFQQKGYRGIGRNTSIRHAKNELIAITDAGCIPDKQWLSELADTYQQTKADVVAGYYWATPRTPLQEAILPYILVMPDRVNPDNFLPATRSMLVTKRAWKKVGGFDEVIPTCEDYVFARQLRDKGFKIVFAAKATVQWLPIKTVEHFYKTIEEQAQYDLIMGVTRPKAIFVVVRYFLAMILLIAALVLKIWWIVGALILCGLLYLLWAIIKNVHYTKQGWYWLPVLQLFADLGVIKGMIKATTPQRR